MFAGVRYDIEIGLYYNRARYYNPYTGRFLQTDPIGYSAGINWYRYCSNNPINFVDPSGFIRYREQNEPLTAVIYTEEGLMWGLVGEWDIDDIYAWYCCAEGEVVAHDVAGITIYAEIDDPNIIYTGSLIHDNEGEVVRLTDSEIGEILTLIAIEITAPEPAFVYTGYYNYGFEPPYWWPWPQDEIVLTPWPHTTDNLWHTVGMIVEGIIGCFIPCDPVTNPVSCGDGTNQGARMDETIAAAQEYDLWKTFWLLLLFGSE
jgi:RHS repeat-associated protein